MREHKTTNPKPRRPLLPDLLAILGFIAGVFAFVLLFIWGLQAITGACLATATPTQTPLTLTL